jgi:hypothetical protein
MDGTQLRPDQTLSAFISGNTFLPFSVPPCLRGEDLLPASRLQHVRLGHGRHRQAFHGADQIFTDLK